MKQLQDSKRIPSVVAQQTTRVSSDGSRETTTTVHNPGDGGILSRIFMNKAAGVDTVDIDEDAPKGKPIIDVTPTQ
jgi:hypothetical protein